MPSTIPKNFAFYRKPSKSVFSLEEKLSQFPETKELAKTKDPTLTRMPEIPNDNVSFDHIDELDFVEFQS